VKRLKDILYRVSIEAVHGATDLAISKIEFDSRKVESNTAFVAIKGTLSDGHDYIEKAIALGANVIVCEQFPETIVQGITYVQVNDTNEALAYLSANFYDNPSEKIKLVGVTGTNGKTTIASLLYQLFKKAGYKVGLLSTYRDVKKAFFDYLPKSAFAITNSDDKNGAIMLQNTKAKKITYALKSYADYKAQILENQLSGLLLKINDNEVWVKLIGSFNAYNLLAIYAVAVELGIEQFEALRLLSELESVSGRFQFIVSDTKITAIVDYAHTPDALENVLQTIENIRTKNEQLITVVGCGGDRDKTKRPVMANIASTLSDKAIFTSDNPRTENPEIIIQEMEQGVEPQNFKKTISILDRKQAIKTACQLANPNDIILIAGKGHETYQEINGVKYDFDDLQIVTELLQQLNK